MSKVRDFFTSLNKSTKITLISCGCFVALTVVILCFFVLFPISPSDTIQEKYGREAKASKNGESAQIVTTQPADDEEYIASKGTAVSRTVTTTRTARKKNFSVTVTTGDGFFSGGKIPTGGTPYETATTVPIEEPVEEPTEPMTGSGFEEPTEPMTGTGIEDPTEPITGSGIEDPTEPPPVEDPTDPPVELPTDPPAPPPATDPPPVEGGDTENGDTQSW
ncbi:MAG: hypothetical protein IJ010_05840 [Ruminococcus sp.]|nr:hypothetical protein [Ruminococcus sp.]